MAGDVAPNSFENLTQSGIAKFNSKEDKTVSLSLNVYNGRTQLAVFAGGGGKPWNFTLTRPMIELIKTLLRKMKENPSAGQRQPMAINSWDPETKKTKQTGMIGLGFDDNLTLTIDIAAEDLPGKRHIFPVRTPFALDMSNTLLTERDQVNAMIDYLITVLTVDTAVAERISSFKRQMGGNRSGGGGGGNRGYGNNGGGNRGNSGGGSFGGANVSEDDLYV